MHLFQGLPADDKIIANTVAIKNESCECPNVTIGGKLREAYLGEDNVLCSRHSSVSSLKLNGRRRMNRNAWRKFGSFNHGFRSCARVEKGFKEKTALLVVDLASSGDSLWNQVLVE